MITLSEKFMKEAARSACKPTAIVGFVKDEFSAEAAFKSHWDAALSSSNVDTAAVPGEVHIAKTLASTGVTQSAFDTTQRLAVDLKLLRVSGGQAISFSDNMYVLWQEFTPPVTAYLDTITIPFTTVQQNAASTGFIAITDSNEVMLEGTEETPFSSRGTNPVAVSFSGANVLLVAGQTYKIYITQTAIPRVDPTDIIFVYLSSSNPLAGSLRRAINEGPSTEAVTGKDLRFTVTMLPRYQATGSISVKLDLGSTPADPGEWELIDVRDGGTTIAYQAWASATGAFAGEETNLGTIVDGDAITNLKRYYKITATLTASTDRLTTPKVIKIKANFDIWERYCLASHPIEWRGEPLPPIVQSLPQIQYQMDPLEGKASISKFSVDFLDEGFLEEIITTYFLKNNEIRIFVGFDAPDWDAEDYHEFWRGSIVNWQRKTGVITLVCSDWAIDTKVDVPEEDPSTGIVTPITYEATGSPPSGSHPSEIKEDLLTNKINMRDSKIDFQSLTNTQAALPGWLLRRTIPKPTDAWKLIQEINKLTGTVLIPREDGKLSDYLFDPSTAHVAEFGENEGGLNTTNFDARMDTTLINQCIVYFGFRAPFPLDGTVTVTQNDETITGSGTAFIQQLSPGMEVQGPDNRIYVVESIASDTSLELETVYSGANQSGQVLKRPRTDDEGKPSSYQGAAVEVDADSITNYKETSTERFLPSLWLGPNDGTYEGDVRAAEVAARIVDWGKDGLSFASLSTSLEFLNLQVGDFVRLGSRTTLPRNLVGFTWTKWVLVSKTIDFKAGRIAWNMMKVPSGTAFSAQILAYSEWLNASTELVNVIISQWPTEVILEFIATQKVDQLDTEAEWNAYQSISNLTVSA